MPTVPAANLPYNPVPSETPNVGQPDRYQRIDATPEAFGAGVGRAISGLGAQIEKTGDVLGQNTLLRQEQFNAVASDNASNQWQDATNKLLYGDPADPTDTGFYGKHGEDAMRAFPEIRKALDDKLNEARGSLQNPKQQLIFDQETRRMRSYLMSEVGRHYDQQFNTFSMKVAEDKVKNANASAASAIANGNEEEFQNQVGVAMRGRLEALNRQGLGSNEAAVNNALAEEREKAVKMKVETLGTKNPLGALKFLENNKDALAPGEYPHLEREMRSRAERQQTYEDVYGSGRSVTGRLGGSPGTTGWGPHANEAVDEFKKAGVSNAFIHGAVANGLAEGGFKEPWQKAWGTEESYGHWQLHEGGELGGYKQVAGNKQDTRTQAQFLVKRMEELHPGITRSNDPKEVTDAIAVEFEKYRGVQPGQRYGYLAEAQDKLKDLLPNVQTAVQVGGGPQATLVSTDGLYKEPDVSRPLPQPEPGYAPDGAIPGLRAKIEDLDKKIPADDPERFWRSVNEARKSFNAQYADQQRELRQHQEFVKQTSQAAEDKFLQRMTPGNPQYPSTAEILQSKLLLPDAKTKLVGFANREGAADPAVGVSKANTIDLFRQMGTNQVTTEKPVDDAYLNQQITRSDHDWLVKQMRDARTPAGENLAKAKAEAVKAVEVAIRGPSELSRENEAEQSEIRLNQGLPTASMRVDSYLKYIDSEIERYKEQKKNPLTLFNGSNPDNPTKPENFSRFLPSVSQVLNMKGSQPTTDLQTMTPPDLVKWAQKDEFSYEQARLELIRRGYKSEPKQPAPTAPIR